MSDEKPECNATTWSDLVQHLGQKLDVFTLSKARGFIHEFVKLEEYLRGENGLMEAETPKFATVQEIVAQINSLKGRALIVGLSIDLYEETKFKFLGLLKSRLKTPDLIEINTSLDHLEREYLDLLWTTKSKFQAKLAVLEGQANSWDQFESNLKDLNALLVKIKKVHTTSRLEYHFTMLEMTHCLNDIHTAMARLDPICCDQAKEKNRNELAKSRAMFEKYKRAALPKDMTWSFPTKPPHQGLETITEDSHLENSLVE